MKGAIAIIFFLGAIGYVGYQYQITRPCARPIEYSIGTFSNQFGVSQSDFKARIFAAENIWEKAVGKQLFTYKGGAKFTVNLIYDERQRAVNAKQKSEFGLSAAEQNFRNQDVIFNNAKLEYEAKLADHEALVQSFEVASKQYEADVAASNKKGGASKSEYAEFEVRRQSLNAQVAQINGEIATLNALQAKVNDLVKTRNVAAANYNKMVESYNARFSGGLEFDQAEYTGNKINVYEFKNNNDLTIALAHELGHALGMDHVENSKSILYYLTGDQSLSPTAEDIAELKAVCNL